jgi:phosphoribosylanthranilate isomerase
MTQVKICGLTNLEDALVAAEAGADLLGFIFYEPSPRYVTPEAVREIVLSIKRQVSDEPQLKTQNSKPKTPIFIGVFVNATLETITQTLDHCQLDAAQLHGDEPPELVHHFQNRAYKAFRPRSQTEAKTYIQKYLPCSPAPLLPCFLLDAYHPTHYGGTGHVADWDMAAHLTRQYPFLLAGGLTPANVAEAIQMVRPWGVDVSSGVEAARGKKDHGQVREFIRAAKSEKCRA